MFKEAFFYSGVFATALALCLAAPVPATAQVGAASRLASPNHEAQDVQLAVPFGVIQGQLVISGQDLIFINTQQPGGSFVINRDNVRNVSAQDGELTIDVSRPVQNPGGPATRLVFRLTNAPAGQDFAQWFHGGPAVAGSAPVVTGSESTATAALNPQQGTMSFDVKHDHRIGSDRGRLIITPSQVNYESVTNVSDSRQWNMSDIKEVHQDGPYKLKVVTFGGETYNFDLLGQGMSSDQYHSLVQRVTGARVSH